MKPGSLTDLQERILVVLAEVEPRWILTGGGALVGFHTKHRATRDLDLVWHGRSRLDELVAVVEGLLVEAGLEVNDIQRAPSFHRLEVEDRGERCLVDLVSDPADGLTRPESLRVGDRVVLVESRYEILVDKLCALLGRAEVRDLVDVRELLRAGEDLEKASVDAARKDGGYSAVTLSWVLEGLRVPALARAEGMTDGEARDLAEFRDRLVDRLARDSRPS